MTNKPYDTLRDGNLKLAIWKNEGDKRPFLTSDKVVRSYTDDAGNWHETTSLSGVQFLKASRLYQKAYDLDVEFRAKNNSQEVEREDEAA